MADQSTYPTTIDTAPTDRAAANSLPTADWNKYFDAVRNTEVKVGVNTGASGSIDYSIANASGLLLDHDSRHEDTGADEISVAGLNGQATSVQKVSVKLSGGAVTSTRESLVFNDGTGVTVAVDHDVSPMTVKWSASSPLSANTFTGNGTYTPPTGSSWCIVILWGGGGGGGRGDGVSDGAGGGGGGGCYTVGYHMISRLSATVAVTIGGGGAGQTSNYAPGGDGGTTTFGAYQYAYGGGGGGGIGSSYYPGGGGGGGCPLNTGGNPNGQDAGGYGGYPGVILWEPYGSSQYNDFGGGGGGAYYTSGGASQFGGAGGGGGGGGASYAGGAGGSSVYGGGGGGGGSTAFGAGGAGSSTYGGAGGAGGGEGASNGTAPGGGGGGSYNGTSGSGAAGKAIIISY